MKEKIKKTIKTQKKTLILIILIILFITTIFTGYQLFIKKDFRIKNIDNEIIEVGTNYQEKNPIICYGTKFKCKNLTFTKEGKVNSKKLGTYTITYQATHKNKEKVAKKTIKVVDKTKPKITISTKTLKICPNGKPLNTVIRVVDNYDGDITDKIKTQITGKSVTYSVKDNSGNTSTITKKAIIKDDVKPKISLKGEKTEYIKLNSTYQEKGATAEDTCDGDLTKNIKITGKVNTKKVGTYKINYEVTDKSGNKASEVRTVKVTKNINLINQNKKTIYLTFDDGPSKYTNKLLDVLKKYDVKATFFVTNKVKDYPEVIKRAHKEGHTIGLHTWSHSYAIYKSEKSYFTDLYKIENKVYSLTGEKQAIIRFPGGSSNTISKNYQKGIMTKLTKEVEKRGFLYYDWNVYGGDAGETKSTNKIATNIINNLNKRGASIVLQHDIYNYSVNAVEKIIKYGLKHGYSFEAITDKTKEIHHPVNN